MQRLDFYGTTRYNRGMNTIDTREELEMKQLAFLALNKHGRVLAPASEARVIYRDFDPCRATQPIANVEWPAIVAMKPVILIHVVMDGDLLV